MTQTIDRINGTKYDDEFHQTGIGRHVIDGKKGIDTVDYTNSHSGIQADLAAGIITIGNEVAPDNALANFDVVNNIENVIGSAFDDEIDGDKHNNFLKGGNGKDVLYGERGDDTLSGNRGGDTLEGGEGNDILKGGAGNDTYIYNQGDGKDTIIDSSGPKDKAENFIAFGSGITEDQLTFSTDSASGDLKILFKDHPSDEITISGQLNNSSIKALKFADGSTTDLQKFSVAKSNNENNNEVDNLIHDISNFFNLNDEQETQLSKLVDNVEKYFGGVKDQTSDLLPIDFDNIGKEAENIAHEYHLDNIQDLSLSHVDQALNSPEFQHLVDNTVNQIHADHIM